MENNTIIPIRESIHRLYPTLTKAEKKVADYVLVNMDKIVYSSLADVASNIGVGETTMLRFVRKVGLNGYQEFKLSLAQSVITVREDENEEESNNLTQKISNNIIQTLKNSALMINEDDLEKAIHLLNEAKSIYFFGVGTSGITALDAKLRFLRMGIKADAITDPHIQSMIASTLTEKDVVVGFSVSGSNRDTIHSLEVSKKNKAKVISVTYHVKSKITEVSDIVLLGGDKESPLEGGSLTSKISQLFIVDLLTTGVALINEEHSKRMMNKTARSVVNKIF
ncbi:RpiR family transcriptional regulator [Halolactibacillus alkaliphilus]|uniref:RpiR family transcriptional regulator n=1 Tax=Halolactibacillus alkaliphilus TaxID=442899 RepID=A0A511WZN4_9BACI|nr:MurR/RpiR family transcriptional regulator [Halolactibacillus alkaliphilus]GEN56152.1 RpiR family transcriptional regulator [Halolactibacillus alkaliphilus]GGN66866.1 RpiR family transcriptional regulator [Halolactibacillus alkaliphilus]SFO71980.1 transcriptional regulator, RpiR family [Halolactibacillus alkaliphilus]